jgi:uncharacterized protein (UPF0335 family)
MENNQLKAFIDRIENVEAELRDRQEDRKEIYLEAKGNGFDPKIIKKLVATRKAFLKNADAVREESAILRLYAEQLGMQESFGF